MLKCTGRCATANRFWVAGTETWNSTAGAKWGTISGVADSASLPGTGDVAIFDALSGGGTVTVDSPNGAGVVTVQQITMGLFTGTLDFSANNNNVTLSVAFSGTGTGVRTLNMGDGTWLMSATSGVVWDCTTVTNFTLNANSSTLTISASATASRSFASGGRTYNIVNLANTGATFAAMQTSGSPTIATLNLTAPLWLRAGNGATITITNAFNWAGSSVSNGFLITSNSIDGAVATISVASGAPTINWAAISTMAFSGGATFTAINSMSLGGNTGIAITSPRGGGIVSG